MHNDISTPDANLAEITDTVDLPEEAYFVSSVSTLLMHVSTFVFYVLIDNGVAGLTLHFNAVKQLAENFDFLWEYPTMSESELKKKQKG